MTRPVIYMLATLCWTMQSCNSAGDKPITERTYIHKARKDTVRNTYAWQGNLNGKYPVLMWYKEFGDVLKGSLFYTENKNPKPVHLLGTIQGGQYRIIEVWPDGDISGVWEFRPDEHGAEGTWTAPTGDERYNTSLMRTDTAVTITGIEAKGDISGTYVYSYGKTGALGYMTAVKKPGAVVVAFDNVSAAPIRNLAMLDAVELPLKDNEAIYRSEKFGPCTIRIRFYDGFAVVGYMDGKMACGFGNNVGVEGIYTKLN